MGQLNFSPAAKPLWVCLKSPALSNVNDSLKGHEKWRIKIYIIENGEDNLKGKSKFCIFTKCTSSSSLLLCMQIQCIVWNKIITCNNITTIGTYIIIYMSDEASGNKISYKI